MHALFTGLVLGTFLGAAAPAAWQAAALAKLLAGAGFAGYARRIGVLGTLARFAAAGLIVWGAIGLSTDSFLTREAAAAACLAGPTGRPARVDRVLRVRVLGLVEMTGGMLAASRFPAQVVTARCVGLHGVRLRLAWPNAPRLVAGQVLVAQIRLRSGDGLVNFRGPDFGVMRRARGVVATGYVRRAVSLSAPQGAVFDRLRSWLQAELADHAPTHGGVIEALLLGSAAAIDAAEWDTLRSTGTVHLLVVSGLHVGLVGLLLQLLLAVVERVAALMGGRLPQRFAWLVLALGLGGYVLLVGAGVSARRAYWMTLAGIGAWRAGRRVAPVLVLLAAWLLVVAAEPLAAFGSGFWLSFTLVTWLLLGFAKRVSERGRGPWLRELLALHLGCSLVLLPLLMWQGLEPAPPAALANLLAVPWVSVVVVPTTLLILPVLTLRAVSGVDLLSGHLVLLDAQIALLFAWLEPLASWSERLSIARPGVGGPARALALVGLFAVALTPRDWHRRCLAGGVLLTWWFSAGSGATLQPGVVDIEVLDVGQGAAVLLRTARHQLLYDTGPAFPGGGDLAATVLKPALVRAPDLIVLSHADTDHAGGLASLAAGYPDPLQVIRERSCSETPDWSWDGVRFRLWRWSAGGDKNNRSCVLVIEARDGRAILPGDIEAAGEARFVARGPLLGGPGPLFLLVPHHGSRTSSTRAFVGHTEPSIAVVSRGAGNRFGHPAAGVLKTYEQEGVAVYDTARHGAVRWRSDRPQTVTTAREARKERWFFGAPLSAGKIAAAAGQP